MWVFMLIEATDTANLMNMSRIILVEDKLPFVDTVKVLRNDTKPEVIRCFEAISL
jgi:hypothetical protein